MSEKAKIALKSGRLLTAASGAMCGAELEVGKVYLITGRVLGLQAFISLCDFVKPWNNLTNRQRKGFRLIYSRGCDCSVRIPTQYSREEVFRVLLYLQDYCKRAKSELYSPFFCSKITY